MLTFSAMPRSAQRAQAGVSRCAARIRNSRAVEALAAEGRSESGVTLIEVVISAVLVAVIAIATLTGFDAAGRATGDERSHNQATLLAGEDEERLRSLGAEKLGQLGSETRPITENGTNYKVESSARFVSASKESFTCESSGGGADYIQTTSTVTWPGLGTREAVKQSSIVAIPGSTAMLVKVVNQNNEPVEGATVTVSGAVTNASQTTPQAGCVIFGALADKKVNVTATKPNWVNVNGETEPAAKEVTLSATSLTSVEFKIAEPGSIAVEFVSNGSSVGVKSDTFFALQTGASGPFIGGKPESYGATASLSGLFPFVTVGKPPTENPYKIWAGDCEANSPEKVAGITAEKAQVEPGSVTTKKVEVPPLNVTVYKGTTTGEGVLTTATSAKLTDSVCSSSTALNEEPLVYARTVTINGSGVMEPKYQPYSKEMQLCVVGLISGTYYKNTATLKNEAKAGTTTSMFLKKTGFTSNTKALTC